MGDGRRWNTFSLPERVLIVIRRNVVHNNISPHSRASSGHRTEFTHYILPRGSIPKRPCFDERGTYRHSINTVFWFVHWFWNDVSRHIIQWNIVIPMQIYIDISHNYSHCFFVGVFVAFCDGQCGALWMPTLDLCIVWCVIALCALSLSLSRSDQTSSCDMLQCDGNVEWLKSVSVDSLS